MKLALDIASLRRLYQAGELTPLELVDDLLARMAGEDSHHIWISRLDADALRTYARALEGKDITGRPLDGISVASQDSIDREGRPCPAACR